MEGWNNVVYPQPAQQALETISTDDVPGANGTQATTETVNDEQPSTDLSEDGTSPGLTQ